MDRKKGMGINIKQWCRSHEKMIESGKLTEKEIFFEQNRRAS
jgi:hypothetical protein